MHVHGLAPEPAHRVDNIATAVSLVASTRAYAVLPAYALNFLPWSVVSRPLADAAPTIDLVLAYHRANASPVLASLLRWLEEAPAPAAAPGSGG